MARLVLIGTVHLDPDGYGLLLPLLESLNPVTVTVEVSSYALEFRRTKGTELLARLDPFRLPDSTLPAGLQPVLAQLEIPYEYRAAKEYSDRTGAAAVPVARQFAVPQPAVETTLEMQPVARSPVARLARSRLAAATPAGLELAEPPAAAMPPAAPALVDRRPARRPEARQSR